MLPKKNDVKQEILELRKDAGKYRFRIEKQYFRMHFQVKLMSPYFLRRTLAM
jgi:hypothetical protein